MPNQSTHTPLQFIFSPFTRRQPSQNWCDFPVYFGSLMQNVFECQHPTIPPSQHQSISLITAWRSPKKKLELSTNIRFMWGVRIPINLNLLVYTPVDHPVDDICCLRWSEGSTKLRRFVSSTSSPTTPFLKRHTFSNPEIWISDISRPFGRYGIYVPGSGSPPHPPCHGHGHNPSTPLPPVKWVGPGKGWGSSNSNQQECNW